MLLRLIHFVSEGSETHSHKLQRWCNRREWHGSSWGWCLCRNQWGPRSCRERGKKWPWLKMEPNLETETRKALWDHFVTGSVSYLHVRLMTSITPLYLLCWSCRRARTTWYGYVVATANILDNAAIVMYSKAFWWSQINRWREKESKVSEAEQEKWWVTSSSAC